jgi:hypothetical protein
MTAFAPLRRTGLVAAAALAAATAGCGGTGKTGGATTVPALAVHLSAAQVKASFAKRKVELLPVPGAEGYIWLEGYNSGSSASAVTVYVEPTVAAAMNTAGPNTLNRRDVRAIRIENVLFWIDPGLPEPLENRLRASIADLKRLATICRATTPSAPPPACIPPRTASG